MSGVNWLYGEGGLLPWADGKTGSALVGGEIAQVLGMTTDDLYEEVEG